MHLSDGILSNPGPMQVFIRTLTGKTLTFAILPDSTVHELMLMVQDSEGIPPDVQRLIFKGIQMEKMRDLAGVSDTCIHSHQCTDEHSMGFSRTAPSTSSLRSEDLEELIGWRSWHAPLDCTPKPLER